MRLSSKMFPQSSRGAGAGVRQLAHLLILGVMLALLAAAGMATAQERPKSTAKDGFNPKQHFTIVKIEPDAGAEEVRVFFSQPLGLESLQGNLRLLPRVKIDWNRTKLDSKGVLRLRGAFRYGTGYLLTLPETLRVGQKTYHQTVNSFFMTDRPPKVEFVGPQSVIERDSRQLLHVRAQNVNNLRFEGIRVPPLLLPLALAVEKSPADWDRSLDELKTASEGLKPFVACAEGSGRLCHPASGREATLSRRRREEQALGGHSAAELSPGQGDRRPGTHPGARQRGRQRRRHPTPGI